MRTFNLLTVAWGVTVSLTAQAEQGEPNAATDPAVAAEPATAPKPATAAEPTTAVEVEVTKPRADTP